MVMDTVTVILTTPEAEMFKSFNQFHATFALMVTKGVFDVKNGSITMHFDNEGNIQRIERKDDLFNIRK
jgi:hypothetical protein